MNYEPMKQRVARLYTIGHSTHSWERFLQLLRQYGVDFVIDVRSVPHSARLPQFNQHMLRDALRSSGIRYRHAGNILGGRPADRRFYEDEQVQYGRVAASAEFVKALDRVKGTARARRIALMCAEGDPLACHRFLLVARYLRSPNVEIVHILPDGRDERHADTETRMMRETGLLQADLFKKSREEAIEEAYDVQSRRVAFASRPVETGREDGSR